MGGTNFKLDIGVSPDLKKIMSGGSGTGGLSSSTSAIIARTQQALRANFAIDMTLQGRGPSSGTNQGVVTGMPGVGSSFSAPLMAARMGGMRGDRQRASQARWGDLGNPLNPTPGIRPDPTNTLGKVDFIPQMEREILPRSIQKLATAFDKVAGPLLRYSAIATASLYGAGKIAENLMGSTTYAGQQASAVAPSIISGRRAALSLKSAGQFSRYQGRETAEGGAAMIGQAVSAISAGGRQLPQHLIEAAMQYGEKTGDYATAANLLENNPGRLVYLNSKTEAQGGGAIRLTKAEAGVRQRQKDAAENGGLKGVYRAGVANELATDIAGMDAGGRFGGQVLLNMLSDGMRNSLINLADESGPGYVGALKSGDDSMARFLAKHPAKNTYSPIPPGHLPPPGYDTTTGGNRGTAAAANLRQAAALMDSQAQPGGRETPIRSGQ